MRRTVLALVFAVSVWGTASSAAAQNREHQQMAADLRIVQEQQQQVALLLAQLAETLKAINARIDDQASSTRKALADQELVVKSLSTDLSAIRERTQDTDTRIRTLGDEIEAQRTTLAALPGLIAQSLPAPIPVPVDPTAPGAVSTGPTTPATPVVPPAAPPAGTPPTASSVGLSPTRMLDTAKADYFAGQYSLAISGFESLIRTFPRSEAASEAQFYIGESQFAQNKWMEAVTAYGLVLQNYGTSTKMHETLYKIGLAHEQLGQLDSARLSWEQAITSYPDSDGARLAKLGLDRLSRRRP
jgi:tol-pal system protein YbgF